MIKLCYKEYDYKITNGACKSFFDKTGLDLQIVLAEYIAENYAHPEQTLLQRMVTLGKLHSRDIVNHALYAVIKPCHSEVSLDEICDATYRIGWQLSERPDDMSEPYPVVMWNLALDYNEYCNNNIPADTKKKVADT